ncbi:MAG TPA: hypothetical protein PK529_00955 [Verrucomicrobiales bacterium]|nr:hypothetical protein [Verrucomicrobiales bacterium]
MNFVTHVTIALSSNRKARYCQYTMFFHSRSPSTPSRHEALNT